MSAAYEQIVSRLALTASETLEKYHAVEIQGAGEAALADGTGIFAGITQYGGDDGDVVTVVQGIFPVQTKATKINAGTRLKPDASNPGFFVAALAADPSVAVALQELTAGTIGSALTVFSPGTDD